MYVCGHDIGRNSPGSEMHLVVDFTVCVCVYSSSILSKIIISFNELKLYQNKWISKVFQLASNNCIRNFVTFQEVEVSKLGPMFLYRRAFIPARN